MILILECIVICFILFLPCVVVIANGIHNGVFLFEKDVQERVIQMGFITPFLQIYALSMAEGLFDRFHFECIYSVKI